MGEIIDHRNGMGGLRMLRNLPLHGNPVCTVKEIMADPFTKSLIVAPKLFLKIDSYIMCTFPWLDELFLNVLPCTLVVFGLK